MSRKGFVSRTIMNGFYKSINSATDFDEYFDNYPIKNVDFKSRYKKQFQIFVSLLERFDVFHIPFTGCILAEIGFIDLETELFKTANKKIVVLPYGSDIYTYDKVTNLSIRNALLISYPEKGREVQTIQNNIYHYSREADVIIPGFVSELLPYWSITTCSTLSINTDEWKPKVRKSSANPSSAIKILHAPNHRGFKGSEYVIESCNRLKNEGYNITLILIENKQNIEINEIMSNEADIMVEQLICDGYGLTAIEAMASGLPVLSNLSNKNLTDMFRRYSYLNECPILSSTPETVYDNLKFLIEHRELRFELGKAGRQYVEKYHSLHTAQYMFGSIYEYFNGVEQNLSTMFHPLLSDYNRRSPKVEHPLVNNCIIS